MIKHVLSFNCKKKYYKKNLQSVVTFTWKLQTFTGKLRRYLVTKFRHKSKMNAWQFQIATENSLNLFWKLNRVWKMLIRKRLVKMSIFPFFSSRVFHISVKNQRCAHGDANALPASLAFTSSSWSLIFLLVVRHILLCHTHWSFSSLVFLFQFYNPLNKLQ